ncbi:HIT family protein [Nonomuraea sp. NPDC000554]|uniref:HIT family protein n=1 Tax=Nonomuraea sp. NPDC000554 TaxID=3154259 RepID=UPI00332A6DCA
MSTDLFCEIITGERPATIVHSDEVAVSFLDARPVFKGHVLVVPRAHVETLADLVEVGPFFERVQAIARAVEEGLEAGGTFVAMNNRVSQSVPHLHVHVVPRTRKDGLRGFFWPRTTYASAEEAESYAERIAKALPGR